MESNYVLSSTHDGIRFNYKTLLEYYKDEYILKLPAKLAKDFQNLFDNKERVWNVHAQVGYAPLDIVDEETGELKLSAGHRDRIESECKYALGSYYFSKPSNLAHGFGMGLLRFEGVLWDVTLYLENKEFADFVNYYNKHQ